MVDVKDRGSSNLLTQVKKRDGRVVDFEYDRIKSAIYRAMDATKEEGVNLSTDPDRITQKVIEDLKRRTEKKAGENGGDYIPDIEDIQNLVERTLTGVGFFETARSYIIYREDRSRKRKSRAVIPQRVKDLVGESKKYFEGNPLGEFVYYRNYSRWKPEEGRRETWVETVDRYMDFMKENLEKRLTSDEYGEIRHMILNQQVVPSMRLFWSAGEAARKSNVTAYNCSFTAPKEVKDFGEIMYLLMCGAGVGFSVENQVVQQLPIIGKQKGEKKQVHVVGDTREGWSDALIHGMNTWYGGYNVEFDYSKIRPAGAILKTMGGRSSGPKVLEDLLNFTRTVMLSNQGRRLSSLDAHDIICKTGETIVAGGGRRSALISLSDLDDEKMRNAKNGQFYSTNAQRAMANNSAVYNEKPTSTEFMREWLALAESGNGERGIFNRAGLGLTMPARRLAFLKGIFDLMGLNPCAEINLQPHQFCNLTEIIARVFDNSKTLMKKMWAATVLGTYQSTLTNFSYLSSDWAENCEAERLLGVSITGIMDSPVVRDPALLRQLREYATAVNIDYAARFGINPSNAITAVKPSGNTSQTVDSGSGMHARHSPYYWRRARINASDPIFHMLKDQKYPYDPEVNQSMNSATTYVVGFPVKSPEGSIFRKDMTALDQLEMWKMFKDTYTDHNPSVTITVKDGEWMEVGNWVYKNWDHVGGLSFLPEAHNYALAPYEEITEEEYHKAVARLPTIDFSHILAYEHEDLTEGAREYACVGGACDFK